MNDVPSDPPKRGRGRPPKLRTCVICAQAKPRTQYDNGTDELCTSCKREIRARNGGGAGSRTLPALGQVQEMMQLKAVAGALATLFVAPPRCECCYEHRHVIRDTYGGVAILCARCEYQVRATGCCRLHNSRMYYPELAGDHVGPAESPPEVEGLFASPEVQAPRYDPAIEPADADV